MINTRSTFGSVQLKKSSSLENRLLIGIDCGTSLTKIILLKKENGNQIYDEKNEYITFDHAIFNNDDFDRAMKWVKNNAYIEEGASHRVHVTGSRIKDKLEIVESTLGLKSECIKESIALIAGLRFGIEGIGFDNLKAPDADTGILAENNSDFKNKYNDSLKSRLTEEESKGYYPCLVQVCGSFSKFVYFDKEGKEELIPYLSIGAHTMLGIGKCLLDTNKYEEIAKLAIHGRRCNVDTQIKDILMDDKDSPYGKYHPDTALFPFGKCMDFDMGLEDHRKEDVAASLVALYCISIIQEYFNICTIKNITKVFVTGNVFRCEAFQREIKSFLILLPPIFKMQMLDFGYSRALGAMLCGNEDIDKNCVCDLK